MSRFLELSWRERLTLAEAVIAITCASLAIRLFPFRRLVTLAALGNGQESPREVVSDIPRAVWAVRACARRLPWRIVCFQQGLALHWMLRRRGLSTYLHYGVAQNVEGVRAHVWVTHDGCAIIGGEEAPNFACLATFPEQKARTALRAGNQ